ncbi:dnaJ homolog subfamily C member 28 [Anthonomus grandis grandis]|uniref:dnaJ homolog subfamily C member 28 n=1 Tax=Anthonomus grandis grandis TaxID=2921223 RepID=UPI0021653B42|nr:dnaJ homolog subfamily C member 28 [Anthonomus grandis grandis]
MALIFTKSALFRSPRVYNVATFSKFGKFLEDKKYKKCFKILEIDESSDQEQIRIAYLQLVKRYHPDSGTEEANADKFQEIDQAFKTIMQKKSKERWEVPEDPIIQEQDIKHTAPQHRQFLTFEGVGSGNPYQREKQYTKVRAMQAAENVYNHRISKVTAEENALMDKTPVKHKIKTKYGYERLVEDLIQESMSKGEFNNLRNSGKPLPDQNRNPYVDFITHKLNEVLIDNGFTPEWILLQKEIRDEAALLRKCLFTERQYFGPYPLTIEDNIEWSEKVYKYKNIVEQINKKIAKFNLVVPVLNKQMLQICLEKEAQRAMVLGEGYEDLRQEKGNNKYKKLEDSNVNIFNFFDFIFKPK